MSQQQIMVLALAAFILYLAATGRLLKLKAAILEPQINTIPGGPAGVKLYNPTTHTIQ